jgi:hypothetical protein
MRIISGLIECRIGVQYYHDKTEYRDQQVHTWEIDRSGNIEPHVILQVPATWRVTDDGALKDSQGTQATRTAQWKANGKKPAPMQVRLTPLVKLESGHSQLSVDGMSMQQLTGQTPGQAPYSVWEFIPFPVLEWNYKLGQPFVGQTNVTPMGNVSWEQPTRPPKQNGVGTSSFD